jgi:YD repeat-containing protein
MVSKTDFLGNATDFTYNSDGFVSSEKDPKGRTTTYSRLPGTAALTRITHPDGTFRSIAYTDNNNP